MKISDVANTFFKDKLGVSNISVYVYNYAGKPRIYIFMSDILNFEFVTSTKKGVTTFTIVKLRNSTKVSDDNMMMVLRKWIKSEYIK